MKTIKKICKTYFAFTRAGIQDSLAYRLYFLGFFFAHLLYCFVMYFIWKEVLQSSGNNSFHGFTLIDMTVFLFITQAAAFFVETDSSYVLGEEIKKGDISMRLIKPINVNLSILFYELGNKVIFILFSFLPVVLGVEIYRFTLYGKIMLDPRSALLFTLSLTLSYILSFYLNLIFGYMAFFLQNLWGTNILKASIINFFSGKVIPLAFFPVAVRTVFEWMPFSSLSYTPVMIYMGQYSGSILIKSILLQIFWIFIFMGICKMVWKAATNYLTVQGG